MRRVTGVISSLVVLTVALAIGMCRSSETTGTPSGGGTSERVAKPLARRESQRTRGAEDPGASAETVAPAGMSIVGHVTDQTGAAVIGATVVAEGTSTTTGEGGRFEIAPPGTDALALRIDAQGYCSEVQRVTRDGRPVWIVLTGNATVSGRVLDADSRDPAAGYVVAAEGAIGSTMRWLSQPTDEAGRFSLPGLPPRELKLSAFRSDPTAAQRAASVRGVTVAPGASDVLLLVGGVGTVRGVFLDVEGRPYVKPFHAFAQFRSPTGELQGGGAFGVTLEGGRFRVDSLPESEMPFDLYLTPEDGTLPQICLMKFAVGTEPVRVEIPASATIAGRIRSEDPAQKAAMVLVRSEDGMIECDGTADANGNFVTRRPVPIGPRYDVLAVSMNDTPGVFALRRHVAAGEREVDLVLGPMGAIRGRVCDRAGKPLTGLSVDAWATNPPRRLTGLHAQAGTGEDGSFEVTQVVPHFSYWLAVRQDPPVRPDLAWAGAVATFTAGAEGVVITVPAGVSLAGRLGDADGAPVQGAVVRAWRPGEGEDRPWLCATATTAADGTFRIDSVLATRVRLVTWRKGREVPLGDVDAPADSLDLRLPR